MNRVFSMAAVLLAVLAAGACGSLAGSTSRSAPARGRCHYDGDCRPLYPQGVCIMPWTWLCGNPSCAMNHPAPCTSASCGEGHNCQAGTCLPMCGRDSDCKRDDRCLEYTPGAPRVCVPLGTCARDTAVP